VAGAELGWRVIACASGPLPWYTRSRRPRPCTSRDAEKCSNTRTRQGRPAVRSALASRRREGSPQGGSVGGEAAVPSSPSTTMGTSAPCTTPVRCLGCEATRSCGHGGRGCKPGSVRTTFHLRVVRWPLVGPYRLISPCHATPASWSTSAALCVTALATDGVLSIT